MSVTLDTLAKIQASQAEWQKANESRFGKSTPRQMLWGVGEEFGEFQHALLKRQQGIRGTFEEHSANLVDAIGDMVVYLCALANVSSVSLKGECLANGYLMTASPDTGVAPQSIRHACEMRERKEDEAIAGVAKQLSLVHDCFLQGHYPSYLWSLLQSINALSLVFADKNCVSIAADVFKGVVEKRDWVKNASDGVEPPPVKKKASKKLASPGVSVGEV
jgi:NTP pyrophosphatase (non-canonical NTP hydrolase)